MKKIFAMVVAAPLLVLFVGVGVWAAKLADTWTPTNTDVLVGGLVSACATGGIVVALILSAFIALVFYSRFQRDADVIPPARWNQRATPTLPYQPTTWREVQPPMLTTKQSMGEWHSQGPASYDLWQDELPTQAIDGQWQ